MRQLMEEVSSASLGVARRGKGVSVDGGVDEKSAWGMGGVCC